jgi:hypothetical protein
VIENRKDAEQLYQDFRRREAEKLTVGTYVGHPLAIRR